MHQQTVQSFSYHASGVQIDAIPFWVWGLMVAFFVIFYIVMFLFSLSIFRLGKRIDKARRIFPPWFAWMFLIPAVGYVFRWMVLPFGIGKALQRYDDTRIRKKGGTLFGLGLAVVIVPLLAWIPGIGSIAGVAGIIVFVLYWVKAVQVGKLL